MSYRALIAFAPLTTLERVNDPAWKGPNRTMYDPGALTFLPGKTSVPVLVNHDDGRVVGTVDTISRFENVDGPWLVAHATIHDAPGWLSKYTQASFAYAAAGTSHAFEREMVRRGLITEVSLLSPDREPAEPLARVLTFHPTEPKPAAREEISYKPVLLVRPGIGQVLGVR